MNTLMKFSKEMMLTITKADISPMEREAAFKALSSIVQSLTSYEEPTPSSGFEEGYVERDEGYLVTFQLPGDDQSRSLFFKTMNHDGENKRQLAQYVLTNAKVESVAIGYSDDTIPVDASWATLGEENK